MRDSYENTKIQTLRVGGLNHKYKESDTSCLQAGICQAHSLKHGNHKPQHVASIHFNTWQACTSTYGNLQEKCGGL